MRLPSSLLVLWFVPACAALDGGQTGEEQRTGDGGLHSRKELTGDGASRSQEITSVSSSACATLLKDLTNEAPVSFRGDLMPIFGLSCAASQCHGAEPRKASLFLGPRCAFDADARWKCTFPTLSSPDASKPQPLTEEIVQEVYTGLLGPSATAPAVRRVTPGAPGASFLVDKLMNTHNGKGYACVKQDPRASGECGDLMPLNSSFCSPTSTTGPSRVSAIAAWIAQGAPNN